jgi:hypothetical protein
MRQQLRKKGVSPMRTEIPVRGRSVQAVCARCGGVYWPHLDLPPESPTPADWICHRCCGCWPVATLWTRCRPTGSGRPARIWRSTGRRAPLRSTLGRLSRPGSCDRPPTRPPVPLSLRTRHLHGVQPTGKREPTPLLRHAPPGARTELLGHRDVSTTMIYAHVLKWGAVQSSR